MLNGDSGRLLSGAPGQKLGVVRPHCPPQINGEQFQTEMDADWKSVSSVKCRMRFDTSTHRQSDSGLKRYFMVNKFYTK